MTGQQIEELFEEKASAGDGAFAIAYALIQLTAAQKSVAYQLECLGLGGAASNMGAIEFFACTIGRGLEGLTDAVRSAAED